MDLTTKFKAAIEAGSIILPTSCVCGGRFAWLTLRPSGAYEMYGCICHNPPPSVITPPEEEVANDI